jgi:tRNA U34 5-carboxymethylaminomethyl modifying enzyme MnmG/GidA
VKLARAEYALQQKHDNTGERLLDKGKVKIAQINQLLDREKFR